MLTVRRYWTALWYQILPNACVGCAIPLTWTRQPFFCDACIDRLPLLGDPRCPRCGAPFVSPVALTHSPRHQCGRCRTDTPSFERAWAPFVFDGAIREAIHRFKYRKTLALGNVLGRLLAERLPQSLTADVVIPVPLAPSRLREREFNQALFLALAVGERLGCPVDDAALERSEGGAPQTGLSRRARLRNLRRRFRVVDTNALRGKRILLVDDVFTTGTTANECAKGLRKAGSGQVSVVTLARAVDSTAVTRPTHSMPSGSDLRRSG
ncbi:MAG: ComF family protein [Nitrospiraceae bacterium]